VENDKILRFATVVLVDIFNCYMLCDTSCKPASNVDMALVYLMILLLLQPYSVLLLCLFKIW